MTDMKGQACPHSSFLHHLLSDQVSFPARVSVGRVRRWLDHLTSFGNVCKGLTQAIGCYPLDLMISKVRSNGMPAYLGKNGSCDLKDRTCETELKNNIASISIYFAV